MLTQKNLIRAITCIIDRNTINYGRQCWQHKSSPTFGGEEPIVLSEAFFLSSYKITKNILKFFYCRNDFCLSMSEYFRLTSLTVWHLALRWNPICTNPSSSCLVECHTIFPFFFMIFLPPSQTSVLSGVLLHFWCTHQIFRSFD